MDHANALFGWLASVEGGVFRLAVEAGTVFGDVGEVAVTDNSGLGIGLLEILQEEPEGGLLSGSAGVGASTKKATPPWRHLMGGIRNCFAHDKVRINRTIDNSQ